MAIAYGGTTDDWLSSRLPNRRLRFYTSSTPGDGVEFTAFFSDEALTVPVDEVLTEAGGYWPRVYVADDTPDLWVGEELRGGHPTVVAEVPDRTDVGLTQAQVDARADLRVAAAVSGGSVETPAGAQAKADAAEAAAVGEIAPAILAERTSERARQDGTYAAKLDVLRKTVAALRDPNRYIHPAPPTVTHAPNQTSSAFTAGTYNEWMASTATIAALDFTNGVPEIITANSTDFVANRVHGGPDSPFRVGWETDADTVEVYLRLASATGAYYRLLIDGQLVSSTDTNLTGTAGTVSRLTLAFSSAEPRRIELELHLLQFRGVRIVKTRGLWKPTRPKPVTTLVYGDSIAYGTGADSSLSAWPYTFARLTGLDGNIVVNAQGGTGYLNPGQSVEGDETFIDRITANASDSLVPDLVVLAGGINDSANNGYTSGALTAAVRAALELIEATWPGTPVILLGAFFPNHDVASGVRTNITAANTAVLAAADEPNVIGSVDMSAWITSDNDNTYISGDSTHPTQAGHTFYAHRIAAAVRDVLDAAA